MKLFRSDRKEQIEDGKFIKFIKYSLGEILLVMIGILLALQVGNWNTQREENKRIESFKLKLESQLDNNITSVNAVITTITTYFENTTQLLPMIGQGTDANWDENINYLVASNSTDYHLNLDMNTIIEGSENGDINLLKSDSLKLLRNSIYELITFNKAVIEREQIANADLNQNFLPYLIDNYNLRNLIVLSPELQEVGTSNVYQGDNYKMLNDQKFENLITLRLVHNKEFLLLYTELLNKLENTKKLM